MWDGKCDYCKSEMEEINDRGDYWCPWCGALFANDDNLRTSQILCKVVDLLEGRGK